MDRTTLAQFMNDGAPSGMSFYVCPGNDCEACQDIIQEANPAIHLKGKVTTDTGERGSVETWISHRLLDDDDPIPVLTILRKSFWDKLVTDIAVREHRAEWA
jgi:hypothetical protein